MVQIFAYFGHIQIVRKLEPTEIFPWDYEINRFFLAQWLFAVHPDIRSWDGLEFEICFKPIGNNTIQYN